MEIRDAIAGLPAAPAVARLRQSRVAPGRKTASGASACGRCLLLLLVASAPPLAAQAPPTGLRAQIESARLGSGYAQMINLAATPDLSAAQYDVDGSATDSTIEVLRLPYQARWLPLGDGRELYWRVAGGYMQLKSDLPFDPTPTSSGNIASKWSAYSGSAGLFVRLPLGHDLALEPAIDVTIARLENRANYQGAAEALQPAFDRLLFNWNTNAWLATPGIALSWMPGEFAGRLEVRGHVARSWIWSFDETDPVQKFSETANVYSIRAEYARPTGLHAFGRALDWVLSGGYAGFFGANRDALGFTGVAEVGAGLQLPLSLERPDAERLRLTAAYLFGADVQGWTIGIRLQY